MRLTEDHVRQGILHPDVDVRFACLRYFAEGNDRNTTIMPSVIEALEGFGRTRVFRFSHPISDLAQTPETIEWVVQELQKPPGKTEDEEDYCGVLSRLICHADPRLVEPHVATIQNAPGFHRTCSASLMFRLALLAWDGAALWNELEIICENGKSAAGTGRISFGAANDIVEALARQGDQHAARMMSLLSVKIESFVDNPMIWMEPLMVRLAGELRYEPAVPLIVGKLHEDGDILNEQCQNALSKIGTDSAVEAIRDAFQTGAEWHFRLYASGVLGRIHSDLAVQVGIELLRQETNPDLLDWLAQAVVDQFSFEGNEAAHQVLLDHPDFYELQRHLVTACTLMDQSFPELEEWRREIAEKSRQKPFMFGGEAKPSMPPDSTRKRIGSDGASLQWSKPHPLVADEKVGRNDPCPCGSGKKYKKCCMDKGS